MHEIADILGQCACHRVRTAARAVTRAYDDALRPVGLRATQLAVLLAAASEDAPSITAIAATLGMDRTTLTRNLNPLVADRLVAVGAEGWRRSRSLAVTRKGRARLREALPLWQTAQQALQRRLGGRKWELARTSLDDLIAAA
jgi:DNA-binding MarR family transcriptional regulator